MTALILGITLGSSTVYLLTWLEGLTNPVVIRWRYHCERMALMLDEWWQEHGDDCLELAIHINEHMPHALAILVR